MTKGFCLFEPRRWCGLFRRQALFGLVICRSFGGFDGGFFGRGATLLMKDLIPHGLQLDRGQLHFLGHW